jgi:hypothetical protein
MVYYASLSGTSKHIPIVAVYALLQSCAGVFLACLSQGFICRGGIEVGIAGEFFQNEIYGPALYQAHRLESVEAQYPRIVVGLELYRFITTVINYSQTVRQKRSRSRFAKYVDPYCARTRMAC